MKATNIQLRVTYDDAGNITIDSKFRNLQFQYDANNRQKQSSNLDDTGVVVSVYDAGGQRLATQVAGALTNVCVYDAMGKLVAEYGQPSAGPGGTTYLTSDHNGSPRVITSGAGTVMSRHDYTPFGEELGTVGMRTSGQGYGAADAARQKYAGMESDDGSGMAATLWRKYDSSSGRWTSPDPYTASMTIANPQSFNRYSYVGNDPVNMRDPSGLMTQAGQPDPEIPAPDEPTGGDPPVEPPGDPFETGRSITTKAAQEFDDGVKKSASEAGNAPAPPGKDGGTAGSDGKAGEDSTGGDPQNSSGTITGTVSEAPQQTSEAQQQPQSQDATWKEQLRGDIRFERIEIAAYRRFGPTARTVEELESRVNTYVERHCHCHTEVAGSTSSSGQTEVRPNPNPYKTEATRVHEEVHRQRALRGIARYGANTPEFNRWWTNPRLRAADEVKAYSADIRYMQQVLRQ